MGSVLSVIFQVAGLVLGVYMIWPDIDFFVKISSAVGDAGRLTFLKALEIGEHTLLYSSLVLMPAMHLLSKILGHKLYSALTVLLFSGLSVVFARILHASLIDGYAFFISQHQVWPSIARPAAIFAIVSGNWLVAFAEMYRVAKVAGK